ncbi:uncharacterized protein MKK02DRAFT_28360 [Dioszegia hungarica]|uniref:Uncharacterized protein n=1 Tax=Dioszegia hungarica TaxID=4972 RepID=A0AA38H3R3_9TREE|nr:uncharacterized protein MKK02DRAFT_28360 [Dioszegia hungarica]KAI9633543.1 hypothetical protein MKK02DRAFT_28360 [Dioszegia hungarica]
MSVSYYTITISPGGRLKLALWTSAGVHVGGNDLTRGLDDTQYLSYIEQFARLSSERGAGRKHYWQRNADGRSRQMSPALHAVPSAGLLMIELFYPACSRLLHFLNGSGVGAQMFAYPACSTDSPYCSLLAEGQLLESARARALESIAQALTLGGTICHGTICHVWRSHRRECRAVPPRTMFSNTFTLGPNTMYKADIDSGSAA